MRENGELWIVTMAVIPANDSLIHTIFKAQLGILYAEIDNEFVKISCNQSDPNFNYCGGTLYLYCNSIKIFDQVKRELSIDNMDKLCNEYWNHFGDQK